MIQNTYLRKCITRQCSKLSACLSLIQSGKIVMFHVPSFNVSNDPVVLVDFRGRFEHVFGSLRHICTNKEESRLVGYISCKDTGG